MITTNHSLPFTASALETGRSVVNSRSLSAAACENVKYSPLQMKKAATVYG